MEAQQSLTSMLVRRGIIASDDADRLHALAHGSTKSLYQKLLEEGFLSESELAQALAEQAGLPYHSLEDYRVDFNTYPAIPVDWMRQHGFVPLEKCDGVLTIAYPTPPI